MFKKVGDASQIINVYNGLDAFGTSDTAEKDSEKEKDIDKDSNKLVSKKKDTNDDIKNTDEKSEDK